MPLVLSSPTNTAPAAGSQLHPPRGLPADCNCRFQLWVSISRRPADPVSYPPIIGADGAKANLGSHLGIALVDSTRDTPFNR